MYYFSIESELEATALDFPSATIPILAIKTAIPSMKTKVVLREQQLVNPPVER